jgi:hypothetical protein
VSGHHRQRSSHLASHSGVAWRHDGLPKDLKLLGSHWDEQVAFNNTIVRAAPQDLAADALKSLVTPAAGLVALNQYVQLDTFVSKAPPKKPAAAAPPADAAIKNAQIDVEASLQSALADIQDATTTLTCLETYKPVVTANGNVSCDQTCTLDANAFKTLLNSALQNAIDTAK